ncbi:MAG TPA: LysR substrate-binding domain-containing protein [Azospirillaceae bacterium]|nr:LysR substrate-binding domain-containing protein [Azospirillaceae bacterium]
MPHRALRNLDIDLLRAFVVIADLGSFTRAGERLLRNQSTLSLQIKRLEEALGKRLLERNAKGVRPTPEGEQVLGHARRILELNDELVARVQEPALEGLVRLGTPEDFATAHLPNVLARFARAYPRVSLEVTCDLTLNLLERFHAGAFDLVLVKREPSRAGAGTRVWREPLVWVAAAHHEPADDGALPLVVSPEPCVYRKRATEALDRSGRSWRVAYSCGSLVGQLAAVRAGLGMTVLPKEMVPQGLTVFDGHGFLPDLHDTEIALLSAPGLAGPGLRLHRHIVTSLEAVGEAGAPGTAEAGWRPGA